MDAARYDRIAWLCRVFLPPHLRVGVVQLTIAPLRKVTVTLCRHSPPFVALEGAIREATAYWALPESALRDYELEFGEAERTVQAASGSVMAAGATWFLTPTPKMFVALTGCYPWAETLFHEFGHVYTHYCGMGTDEKHQCEWVWKRVHDKTEWRPWMQFTKRAKLQFPCINCGTSFSSYDRVVVLDPKAAPDGLVRLRYVCLDTAECGARQRSWKRRIKRGVATIAAKLGVHLYLGE